MARSCALVRLSRNVDYLIDNQHALIISETQGGDQEETGRAEEHVPKLGTKSAELGGQTERSPVSGN